jgi:hypothetical protein
MSSGRTAPVALVLSLLVAVVGPASAGAAADPPHGLLDGALHIVRLRPRLADLPDAPRRIPRAEASTAAAAVAACDQSALSLPRVPTTRRADDAAPSCVVLPQRDTSGRLYLSRARVSGDGILSVRRRRVRNDRYEVVLRLTPRGAALIQLTPPELAGIPNFVDLDGEVIGTATLEDAGDDALASILVSPPSGRGYPGEVADELVGRLRQARHEQLIRLADGSSLTRRARELLVDRAARVDDKTGFNRDCPNPESAGTLVLGCYTGNHIYLLRVDQANLTGVMNVSLAHEMLHAAFDELPVAERRTVVRGLERFMDEQGDPRIEELLVEYDRLEPGARATELHSLIGTQVASLPRALERHYARYFDDRADVVAAFVGYQSVFDDLQNRYEALEAQADALQGQIADADGAYQTAGALADRLFEEIQSLRRQGRDDESNALVDQQNAAADQANALVEQYNGLVDQYNAVVAELNTLATALNESYNAISPTPIPLPTDQ